MSYRYIGNKARFLPTLLEAVGELVPVGATVADPMCGTATVSEGLRRAGYRVIASDLMTYSYHHAMVRLLIPRAPAFRELRVGRYADVLDYLNGQPAVRGYAYRELSPAGRPLNGTAPRRYLSAANAAKLDAITGCINEWRDAAMLTAREHSLLRHDLVLAVNRVANIAGTYGHFHSIWSNGSRSSLQLVPSKFLRGNTAGHRVMQGPIERLAPEIEADLCYLDPPYTKRQYAANYHVVETVARGDAPESIGVSGLRPWRDQYSDFCSKVRLRRALQQVISAMRCRRFLISYSEDGLLSRSDLTRFLSTFGKVKSHSFPFPRFRSNESGRSPIGTEFLFYLVRGQHA